MNEWAKCGQTGVLALKSAVSWCKWQESL